MLLARACPRLSLLAARLVLPVSACPRLLLPVSACPRLLPPVSACPSVSARPMNLAPGPPALNAAAATVALTAVAHARGVGASGVHHHHLVLDLAHIVHIVLQVGEAAEQVASGAGVDNKNWAKHCGSSTCYSYAYAAGAAAATRSVDRGAVTRATVCLDSCLLAALLGIVLNSVTATLAPSTRSLGG